MYYKWDTEKKVLFINTQGFDSFLREERGTVILSDLIPYNLGALGNYNPLENKVMNNTTESAKPKSGRRTWTEIKEQYDSMTQLATIWMSPDEAEQYEKERQEEFYQMMNNYYYRY